MPKYLSDLVRELEQCIAEHGNLPVYADQCGFGYDKWSGEPYVEVSERGSEVWIRANSLAGDVPRD